MISIAIDGPSGAGKSTISRKAAEKFGFIYVDTGAIYRTIGLATKIHGVSLDDTAAVVALLPTLEIELKYNDAGEQHMYLDGNDVSRDIRLPEVELQQALAAKSDVIMDGRDIGTVILPNAELKIFLTADVRDRARRRYEEQCAKGMEKPFDEVLAEMEQRDEQDTKRAAAPLKAAEDAVLLDTSGNTLEESIDEVCRLISEKTGRAI